MTLPKKDKDAEIFIEDKRSFVEYAAKVSEEDLKEAGIRHVRVDDSNLKTLTDFAALQASWRQFKKISDSIEPED